MGGGVAIISRLELGGDISAESFISGVVVVDGTVVGTVDGVDADVEYVLKVNVDESGELAEDAGALLVVHVSGGNTDEDEWKFDLGALPFLYGGGGGRCGGGSSSLLGGGSI